MQKSLLLFFITISSTTFAQGTIRTKINGKINAKTNDLEGIYVINVKTEKMVFSQKEGYFTIEALPGETLLFSAIHLKEVRIVLKQEDFDNELFLVKMESTITQLQEVVVNRYDHINAVSLGISPKGIKYLSQGERHLKTATNFDTKATADPQSMMAGGSVSFDPILNLFSGRTTMLKKELIVENKLAYMKQIESMFDESHFTNTYKIPSDYVNGFKYYVVENEQFTRVLKTKNKITIEFLLAELAVKYNEIIASEK